MTTILAIQDSALNILATTLEAISIVICTIAFLFYGTRLRLKDAPDLLLLALLMEIAFSIYNIVSFSTNTARCSVISLSTQFAISLATSSVSLSLAATPSFPRIKEAGINFKALLMSRRFAFSTLLVVSAICLGIVLPAVGNNSTCDVNNPALTTLGSLWWVLAFISIMITALNTISITINKSVSNLELDEEDRIKRIEKPEQKPARKSIREEAFHSIMTTVPELQVSSPSTQQSPNQLKVLVSEQLKNNSTPHLIQEDHSSLTGTKLHAGVLLKALTISPSDSSNAIPIISNYPPRLNTPVSALIGNAADNWEKDDPVVPAAITPRKSVNSDGNKRLSQIRRNSFSGHDSNEEISSPAIPVLVSSASRNRRMSVPIKSATREDIDTTHPKALPLKYIPFQFKHSYENLRRGNSKHWNSSKLVNSMQSIKSNLSLTPAIDASNSEFNWSRRNILEYNVLPAVLIIFWIPWMSSLMNVQGTELVIVSIIFTFLRQIILSVILIVLVSASKKKRMILNDIIDE